MSLANPCCLVIAEAGNNHEGRLDVALELLERAKEAGADLVKFQAGTADGFARDHEDPEQLRKYRPYELRRYGYNRLITRGLELGIPVFFSVWSLEFMDYLSLSWVKIPARQCNIKTIKKLDGPGTFISIPHTMSLGAVSALPIREGIPMHVVAEYPAKDALLGRFHDLRMALKRQIGQVGYSDHTIGIYWAVRMATDPSTRCRAIEKHFTLAHDFGPLRDHKLSATPEQFREMVERIKS